MLIGTQCSLVAGILMLTWLVCGLVSDGQSPAPPKTQGIDLGGGIEMEFVLIPAGSFVMGDEHGQASEKGTHRVTISRPFYMGKYEVTREQYTEIMQGGGGKVEKPKYPVDFARWNTCGDFLAKLNQKRSGVGFRLPTEAEWEYACRAGTSTRYSFDDDEAHLAEYAWFGDIAGGAARPVGQKKPNPWGLYDMHGNVWEWCQDIYGPYSVKDQIDPTGPAEGQRHVFRGGAWNCPADRCRSATRDSFPAAAFVLGFRVVMPLPLAR